MRKRKPNHSVPAIKKRKPYLQSLIIVLAIIAVMAGIGIYIGITVRPLKYFLIKDIIVKGYPASDAVSGADISYLKGRNIFSVDLVQEAWRILALYPQYKRVRLVRVLPDRLFVEFVIRKPVACVKLYRTFYVGEDMVLFNVPEQAEPFILPVITGLETKIFGPKSGKRYMIPELALALNIIKEFNADDAFKEYQLKKVDVVSIGSASIVLLAGASVRKDAGPDETLGLIEIKVGYGNLTDKMNLLRGLLLNLQKIRNRIKYIDLRFQEPVIKLKDNLPAK